MKVEQPENERYGQHGEQKAGNVDAPLKYFLVHTLLKVFE